MVRLDQEYDLIRDAIESSIPGFESYNKRVRQPDGFYLPNAAREGKFNTPSGKALFTIHPIPRANLEPRTIHYDDDPKP